MTAVVLPANARDPVASSYRTAPNEKEVRSRVERLAPRLLRRHVCHSAQGRVAASEIAHGGGRARRLLAFRHQLCQAEIENLQMAEPRQEKIGRLQVAMNDVGVVRRRERIGKLDSQIDEFFIVEATAVSKGVAFQQLHHQERSSVHLVDFVNRADVRMIER